jgi:hypothetical protein
VKELHINNELDVRVPKENLIGKENKGFKYIMHNFNSERMGIVIQATRFSRVCIEESIKVSYFYRNIYYWILTKHFVSSMPTRERPLERS